MLFETLTSSGSLFNVIPTKYPVNGVFKKQNECYPDDWCVPKDGTECCPGPENCYPTRCSPCRPRGGTETDFYM